MKYEDYQAQKTKMGEYEGLTNRISKLNDIIAQTDWKNNKIINFSANSAKSEFCTFPETMNPDLDFQAELVNNFATALKEKVNAKIAALEAEREAL